MAKNKEAFLDARRGRTVPHEQQETILFEMETQAISKAIEEAAAETGVQLPRSEAPEPGGVGQASTDLNQARRDARALIESLLTHGRLIK